DREYIAVSKKTPLELGKRERQILDTLQRLGEASVASVREHLADPPSYSSVRTMLGLLVKKGWIKHRVDGKRYLYRPAQGRLQSQRGALKKLLGTFFAGSAGDAMAALVDISAGEMTEAELQRVARMIEEARKSQSAK